MSTTFCCLDTLFPTFFCCWWIDISKGKKMKKWGDVRGGVCACAFCKFTTMHSTHYCTQTGSLGSNCLTIINAVRPTTRQYQQILVPSNSFSCCLCCSTFCHYGTLSLMWQNVSNVMHCLLVLSLWHFLSLCRWNVLKGPLAARFVTPSPETL